MFRALRTVPAALGVLAGCAAPSLTPEQLERRQLVTAAIEPCRQQHPGIREVDVDEYGHVSFQAQSWSSEVDAFRRCANEAIMRVSDRRPLGAGTLAATAGDAKVSWRPAGTLMLVPVLVNGVRGTFLLDTGAGSTLLQPGFASRAGIDVPANAPRALITVAGGGQYSVPVVTAKSVRLGEAAVEGMDVGVFQAGAASRFDGVLGGNFLRHFRMTIDRQDRLLILEIPKKNTP